MPKSSKPTKPSEVTPQVGVFDRFAGKASDLASRAPFFLFCVLLVAAWLIEGIVMVVITGHFDKFSSSSYQLQINTTTTIITFLMVALLQNSETRADQAIQHKLNAMAGAMATMMEHMAHGDDHSDLILKETEELRAAVGLENRESST